MMKKLINASLIIFCLFTLLLCVSSCGEDDPPPVNNSNYTVTYYSDENTIIWETTVERGTLLKDIKYDGPTPIKAPKGQISYIFSRWLINEGDTVLRDTSVYASYTEEMRFYEVIYKNYNGIELDREIVRHGDDSTYTGSIPTKASDTKLYTFKGWNQSAKAITENKVLIAEFSETPLKELSLTESTKKDSDSFACFSSSEGDYYFDLNLSTKLDSRLEYFKIGQNKSLNVSAIKSIKNISFTDLDGSVVVEYGWRLDDQNYYCKSATATKTSPTVHLEFDPEYIRFYSPSGTAYANGITIRYTNDSDSYNPLVYSDGITFTLLDDGSYEAKYGDVKQGNNLSSSDEKIIPDGNLDKVVFPMYYLGAPVSTVSTIVGNYTSAFIPEGVTTVNFGGIYSDRLVNLRVPSTLELALYTYVQTTSLAFYYNRHPNLSVTAVRGAEYLGNESAPCVVLLRAVETPKGMTSIAKTTRAIASNAFMQKKGVFHDSGLQIPRDVVSIGENALSALSVKITLEQGSKLRYIDRGAFSYANLGDFTLPKGVGKIGNNAFLYASIESFTIPNDSALTEIGADAFAYSTLKEIYISSKITSIGPGAFSSCQNLKSVTLEDNHPAYINIDGHLYTKDGSRLISYMSACENPVFVAPDSLKIVTSNAFLDCHNLKSIYLGKNVKQLAQDTLSSISVVIYTEYSYIPSGWNYFSQPDLTLPIWLEVAKENIVTIDDIEYIVKNNSAILTRCLANGKGSLAVPQSIELAGNTYPVSTIGAYAFHKIAFTDGAVLTLPSTVTDIEKYAFSECSVGTVNIPERVENIGDYAFEFVGFNKVHLPNTIKSVGVSAFYSLTNPSIYYEGTVEDFFANVELFNCLSYQTPMYFKIDGEYVPASDIHELPTYSRFILDMSLLNVFNASGADYVIRLSKDVKVISGYFDTWVMDIGADNGTLTILYEGTAAEFLQLMQSNYVYEVHLQEFVYVFYSQDV